MNFLADESVDRPIDERLRQGVHQVSYIVELGQGMPDYVVLSLVNQEKAAVISCGR